MSNDVNENIAIKNSDDEPPTNSNNDNNNYNDNNELFIEKAKDTTLKNTNNTGDIFEIPNQEVIDFKKSQDIDAEKVPYSFNLFWINFIPVFSGSLVNSMGTMIEYSFLSRLLGEDYLTGISLGETYVCIAFYYFGSGFMEGICIECSKSFGRGKLRRLGVQVNQFRFMLYIFTILNFFFSFIFGGKILKAIQGDNTDFVDISIKYIPFGYLFYFLQINYEVYCKYAEVQLVFAPVVYSVIVSIGVQTLCLYLFLQVFKYEFYGVVLSQIITESSKILFMVVYFLIARPYPESHFFMLFDKRMIRNMWANMKLCLLSALIFFFEFSGESILGMIASTLSTQIYARHIIIAAIGLVPYSFCFAILSASCIIVGIYVGRNEPETIKKIIKHSIAFGNLIILIILAIIAIFPNPFLEFFGEADEQLEVYYTPLYWMLASYYFDYWQNNLQGFLRGFGYIRLATGFSLFFNLIVQGVLSYFLGKKWGNSGLYIAVLIMYVGLSTSYFIILMNVNIKASCKEIKEEDDKVKEGQSTLLVSFNSQYQRVSFRRSVF